MTRRQVTFGYLSGLSAMVLALVGSTLAYGQLVINTPAGVEVDADGVLRTRMFPDPTGHLTRRRLAEMAAALDRDIARPSPLRKISLTRLEAVIADRIAAGAGITDDMRYLAGLTGIQYVFCYPESGDIVIAGPAEGYGLDLSGRVIGLSSGRSVLELQDLVVALRTFAPDSPPTKVVGCSIDPTQEGLRRMRQYLVSASRRVGPGNAKVYAEGMRQSLGLQNVSIRGVSPHTHFAQVLVEADYRMKLIGIGLEQPPVKISTFIQKASPSAVARNALQRWYFVPDYDSVRVSEDQLAMQLIGNGVKLIGEDEFVSADGVRRRSGRVDRASQAFVTSFTRKYPQIARRSPVFAQLRNLIDMVIASAYIQKQDFYAQTNWDLGVFGREEQFAVETLNAPRQVETAVNAVWKGHTLMTPIGGGVNIQPQQAIAADRLKFDTEGKIRKARATIDLDKLDQDRWWWD